LSKTLTAIQQANLESLNLSIGPKAQWTILNIFHGEIVHSRIDFADYPLNTERILLAQRLLLLWWSPRIVEEKATIQGNDFRKADILMRLLALIEQKYKGRALCELDKSDWANLLTAMVFYGWCEESSSQRRLIKLAEPNGKHVVERATTVLRFFYKAYQEGAVSDGPEFLATRAMTYKVLGKELEARGIDFSDWKTGGSYGSIPFVTAHLLLADAIATLRSYRTKQLLLYFKVARESDIINLHSAFWGSKSKTHCFMYRNTSNINCLSNSPSGNSRGSQANRCKIEFALPLHNELLKLHTEEQIRLAADQPFQFPWKFYNDLVRDYRQLGTAIYIIFLSVMGKRGPSEIRTLRGIDITPSNSLTGQDATMRPSILKTHKGLRIEQGVTNYIDEAFSAILHLSYYDKTSTKLPLFSVLPPKAKARLEPRLISVETAGKNLKKYYAAFCARVEAKVEGDFLDLHERIASHQFRHAFAEFALRKFDGNVEELFRQHALHSYNHWWTKRYTFDKLDADEITRINRAYIRELVPRVLHDSVIDPDFVGAMALFIKKTLGEQITVVSPEEAEIHIEAFCDQIEQVTAHEYGWCLLHKSFEHAAQCKDSSGTPNPKGTSWEKCEGCVNFTASRNSHLTKQTQILISHVDFIEQQTFQLPSLKRASREAIKNATQLFPELKPLANIE